MIPGTPVYDALWLSTNASLYGWKTGPCTWGLWQRNDLPSIAMLLFVSTGFSLQEKKSKTTKLVNLRETSYTDLLGSWVKIYGNFKHLKTPIKTNSKHGEIAFLMIRHPVL